MKIKIVNLFDSLHLGVLGISVLEGSEHYIQQYQNIPTVGFTLGAHNNLEVLNNEIARLKKLKGSSKYDTRRIKKVLEKNQKDLENLLKTNCLQTIAQIKKLFPGETIEIVWEEKGFAIEIAPKIAQKMKHRGVLASI